MPRKSNNGAGVCLADLQSAVKMLLKMNLNDEWEEALRAAGITHLQALRLALELVEQSGAGRLRGERRLNHCRQVIRFGAEQRRAVVSTVSFAQAAESALKQRQDRRPRTVTEFASVCRRLLRCCPDLAVRRINSMGTEDCAALLAAVFPTLRQRQKGRVILHGIFSHALRQGWCMQNPVRYLRLPAPSESEILPLTLPQLETLLRTARSPLHRCCMPPLGVMLWCGVRPAEVMRLDWSDIDREEHVIVLRPRHSKTGGWRHIPLRAVLQEWLEDYGMRDDGALCPPDWGRRWKRLREAAGLIPWQQDVLRHTFASYHAKRFRDFPALQSEMGHRSAALLRTRYLSMRGLTAEGARLFWTPKALG